MVEIQNIVLGLSFVKHMVRTNLLFLSLCYVASNTWIWKEKAG